jgi:hypothetical protein
MASMEGLVVKENAESSFEERIVKEARLPARDSMNATVLYRGLTSGYTAPGAAFVGMELDKGRLAGRYCSRFCSSQIVVPE